MNEKWLHGMYAYKISHVSELHRIQSGHNHGVTEHDFQISIWFSKPFRILAIFHPQFSGIDWCKFHFFPL